MVFLISSCSSFDGYALKSGTYRVQSTCADAELQEGEITLVFDELFDDTEITFDQGSKFGMPEESTSISEGYVDIINTTRHCRGSLTSPSTEELLLVCKSLDASVSDCRIHLKRQN